MKALKRIVNGTGEVVVVLLAGMLFPVLIWVALAVAAGQKVKAANLRKMPRPTVDELLAEVGLSELTGKSGKVKVG